MQPTGARDASGQLPGTAARSRCRPSDVGRGGWLRGESYRRRFIAVGLPSILTVSQAISARDDLVPKLGEVNCPTLVVVGEEDAALPVALSRRLAAGIRGAELVVDPRAGRLSALEAPEAVTRAIERFLDRLKPTGRAAA